ncbi:hypothetical protein ACFPM0_02610 [Pseudonocardia sulfidoxydans]|uniref:hypothetical protein n=1 Tax=Pseudonocardia sulfidoxydans TaxID=54011 RepID=UPI00361122E5
MRVVFVAHAPGTVITRVGLHRPKAEVADHLNPHDHRRRDMPTHTPAHPARRGTARDRPWTRRTHPSAGDAAGGLRGSSPGHPVAEPGSPHADGDDGGTAHATALPARSRVLRPGPA